MNAQVVLFFCGTTLCALLSGFFLLQGVKNESAKRFALALLATGGAFACWTYAVLIKPDSLLPYVDVGLGFFIIALLLYVWAAVWSLSVMAQRWVCSMALLYTGVLWVVRGLYPSQPKFSPEGLFFFNPHPNVQVLEVFLISAVVIPAAYAVASGLEKRNALIGKVFTASTIAIVIGWILLLTSLQVVVVYWAGWAIGLGFLAMLGACLRLSRTQ